MDTLYIIDCETELMTEPVEGRSFLTGRLAGGLANISIGDRRADDPIVRLNGSSSLNRKKKTVGKKPQSIMVTSRIQSRKTKHPQATSMSMMIRRSAFQGFGETFQ